VPQNPQDVTNPDLVDVADQGDGLTVVDQCVRTSPSSNPATGATSTSTIGGNTITSTNPDLVDVADQAVAVGLPTSVNVP